MTAALRYLLLSSVALGFSQDCSSFCSITQTVANCRYRFNGAMRLAKVPKECIPLDVTKLILDHHAIRELGPRQFVNFTKLEEINLDYNGISNIHDTAFDELMHLHTIKLNNNRLTAFPAIGAKNISVLELTKNRILEVQVGHLQNLTQLTTLLLTDNEITTLHDFVFVDTCKLSKLFLNRNPLERIEQYALVGTELKIMDISETPVTNLPTAGLQNLKELFATSTASLRSFPSHSNLPSIRQLDLTYQSHCCIYAGATYRQDIPFLPTCGQSPSTTTDPRKSDLEVKIQMHRSPAARQCCAREVAQSCVEPATTIPGCLPFESHLELGSTIITIPKCDENATAMPPPMTIPPTIDSSLTTTPSSSPVKCSPLPDDFNSCDDVMGNWFLRIFVWLVVVVNFLGNFTVIVVFLANFKRFNAVKLLLCNMAIADFLMGVYLMTLAVVDARTFGSYADHSIDWKKGGGCEAIGFISVFASLLSLYSLVAITSERLYTLHYALYQRKLTFKGAVVVVVIGWSYAITMAVLPLVGVSDYTSTAICLPFDLSGGGQTYLTVGLSLSLLAFVIIAVIYGYLFFSIAGRGPREFVKDLAVFKKMMVLVLVDFFCWMPIIVIGLISANRKDVAVSLTVAKWLMVFVYPLNSCANPYLYAIFTMPFRRDFFEFWHRFGLFSEQYYRYSRPPSLRRSAPARPRSASQNLQLGIDCANLDKSRPSITSVGTNISVLVNSNNQRTEEFDSSTVWSDTALNITENGGLSVTDVQKTTTTPDESSGVEAQCNGSVADDGHSPAENDDGVYFV